MSYSQMAQLELLNALNNISSEAELNEFKNLVAHFFAQKAQKAIDALWDEGAGPAFAQSVSQDMDRGARWPHQPVRQYRHT